MTEEVWKEARVRTRISGLDRLLYGGLCLGQEPYLIVMKGAADTEKTMFGMQMLYGIAQSLADEDMGYRDTVTPCFISTYNSESFLNSLAVNAFISNCVRYYQKANLHSDFRQASSTFTSLLFNTDKLICKSYPSMKINTIPLLDLSNSPDKLIVEGALYFNVRTNALHMRTSEKRDTRHNMVYGRKFDTIREYAIEESECEGEKLYTSQKLEELTGMKMVDMCIKKADKASKGNLPSKLLGIELQSYSKHKMREIKKKVDELCKGMHVVILIVDEHTAIFDDEADMIISLSSEYADDYLSYYFRITKSRLQETAEGYHQYKRREYGIEVFPSVHSYIQQRWYLRRGLLYTHSDVISECFFEYIDRKSFLGAPAISYSDYIENKRSYKEKCYEDIYQAGAMNFASYDLLNKILIGEDATNEETENIYGNVGSVTGIIGNGNTYKRFLIFGGAFRTALGDEHVLLLLLNKEDITIRRRLACPARLCKRKHKEGGECMRCYEHIHFMNIPMGAITPEEFLYYFYRQIKSKYEAGARIKRIIIDDLQMIDYCYPKLAKDPLFLPALMSICREYGVALYLLCDKQCNLRNPLRALADNIICTEKTEDGNPLIYIERYAGYNITPSKMYCGEVTNTETLFVCHERYNEKGERVRQARNYSIDSTVIKDRKVFDITAYWNK